MYLVMAVLFFLGLWWIRVYLQRGVLWLVFGSARERYCVVEKEGIMPPGVSLRGTHLDVSRMTQPEINYGSVLIKYIGDWSKRGAIKGDFVTLRLKDRNMEVDGVFEFGGVKLVKPIREFYFKSDC